MSTVPVLENAPDRRQGLRFHFGFCYGQFGIDFPENVVEFHLGTSVCVPVSNLLLLQGQVDDPPGMRSGSSRNFLLVVAGSTPNGMIC